MDQQLLIRTKRGVTPTEAGKILYTHARTLSCASASRRSWRSITSARRCVVRCRSAWRRAPRPPPLPCRCCKRCAMSCLR
ncbi:hypothetical protein LNP74_27135 [Klebsiella pneumoniae subsp. pneumoniae]|nr:hypothetical protein [Klebsiella pneumoniae subsp. pneumoniae]